MRRALIAVVVASAMGVVLTGCGLPKGVDGDLTDDWAALGEPVGFVPDTNVCHLDPFLEAPTLAEYNPVDCAEPHYLQTVHVGTFVAEAAESQSPPGPGSVELEQAYQECEERTAEYLGAGFRDGRLWLGVAIPSERGWGGGARWFRCDVAEIASVHAGPVQREGPLAGVLAEDSDLKLGCFTVTLDSNEEIDEMGQVSCETEHEAEFVGVWRADGSYDDFQDEDGEEEVYAGCREVVADFVDVPKDGNLVYRTGVIADWMSEAEWENGNRGFRCYLWLPDRGLSESLADGGTDALPIQTA